MVFKVFSRFLVLFLVIFGGSKMVMGASFMSTVVVEGSGGGYWWVRPGYWIEDGFSKRLSAVLDKSRVVAGYKEVDRAPKLSRVVYGEGVLSDANAVNLGLLYGVDYVINGELEQKCVQQGNVHQCEIIGELRVLKVGQKGLVLRLKSSGWRGQGDGLESALDSSFYELMALLRLWFERVEGNDKDAGASLEMGEKLLLFKGLPNADVLVSLKKVLKSSGWIEDVLERYAGGGMLGLEINPGAFNGEEEIEKAVSLLVNGSIEGYSVKVVGRDSMGIIMTMSNDGM